MNIHWKDGEFMYCQTLVENQGNDEVGRVSSVVAQYLRMQSAAAFGDKEYEISARLATAATYINCSADNKHEPRWAAACNAMWLI